MAWIRLVMIVGGLLASDAASACSCALSTPEQRLAGASRIVAGRVEDVSRDPAPVADGLPLRAARVLVTDVWKGPDATVLTVLTGMDDGDCGLNVIRGQEWLLYVTSYAGRDYAGLCSGSGRVSGMEAATRLGPPAYHHDVAPRVPTPLEAALAGMDAKGVRAALAAGADPNEILANGQPVDLAVDACAADVTDALMAKGARPPYESYARALACPEPAAMVAAMVPTADHWTHILARTAAAGDLPSVRMLLDAGVPPHGGRRASPLGSALREGNLEIATLLRERGAKLDAEALQGAARSEAPEARALVRDARLGPQVAADLLPAVVCDPELLGAVLPQVDGRVSTGDPYAAALEGCPASIDPLLAAGLVPSAAALTGAARRRDVTMVQRLVAGGAPVDGDDRSRPLATAAGVDGNAAVVAVLLAAGADPGAGRAHHRPLQEAVDPAVVGLLVAAGAPLEIRVEEGLSPLEHAAHLGSEASVRILLQAGARVQDSRAVAMAAHEGNGALVDILLRAGAPIGEAAGTAESADVIARLLAAGADPDGGGFGGAWLFRSIILKDLPSVTLLLAAGADPAAADADGETALMVAVISRSGPAILDALLAAGASKTAKDRYGLTAADHALRLGDAALAERLR